MFLRLGALCAMMLFLSPATLFAAEQVTLVDAVKRALAANPTVHSARAASDAAEAGRKSARGAFGPTLTASYGYSRVLQESSPAQTSDRTPYGGMFSAVISFNQNLFTGFRLLSTYQKAALQAESQQLNLRLTQLNLVASVQSAFLSYLQALENVRSQRDSLTRLKEQLQITKASFEVGLRPHLDVLQAEVDVSRAESTLIAAENSRETYKAQINTLLGLPVTAELDYVGILSPVPFNIGLESCLETAYRQRPDLGIAAKAVAIAGKDVKIVQSQYYPQISAYYDITSIGDNLGLRHVHRDGYHTSNWQVGVMGTWTVFEWGQTFYADQQARFVESQMRADEASLKLNAGFDVKSKLLAVRDAEKLISVATKGLEQAHEAYKQAQARYRAQVGTNFDVLDASANLAAAETTLTGAKAGYLTALSALYAAMGELKLDLGLAGK
ncbi:MAG: TolC family protein [Desulfovibrionaceae bacterium]|nr:TolC family protein [Desulfovibrionaceae bacterium]